MSCTEISLGEIASMRYGKIPKKDILLPDGGYPVFSGYRITGYAKEYLYDEPMLIVVAGGVGGTGDVKISPPKSWITNLSIVLDLNEKLVDKWYLKYKLSLENLREKLNTGAAQAQITIENLSRYKIKIPSLLEQRKISSLLSTYDDLIENNRRRIQLLEQAARLLYKEWFVHFRFPGHEHVKIKDGVPEGWKKTTIGKLGNVVTGKTPSKKNSSFYGSDVPFIKTPDMHGNTIVIATEEMLSEEGARSQSNKTLPLRSILVSCIGTVGVVAFNMTYSQTNQQINAIIPFDDITRYWVFFMAKDLKPPLEGMDGGATMANVNKSKFSGIEVIVPDRILLKEFNEYVIPVFDQIEKLSMLNNRLAKARDLLLPRLMNGEIAV